MHWSHELRMLIVLEVMYQVFLLEFGHDDDFDNRTFFARGYWKFAGGRIQ